MTLIVLLLVFIFFVTFQYKKLKDKKKHRTENQIILCLQITFFCFIYHHVMYSIAQDKT